jgi:hypothetical protein
LLACLLACCLLATYKNKYENIKSRFILNWIPLRQSIRQLLFILILMLGQNIFDHCRNYSFVVPTNENQFISYKLSDYAGSPWRVVYPLRCVSSNPGRAQSLSSIPAFVLVRQSKRATPKNAPGNETVKLQKEYVSRVVC